MSQRYTLDTKINALNQLDEADGDILLISEKLSIASRTLSRWRKNETNLRRAYNQKRKRQIIRLKADLQQQMLDKGLQIVAQMDDETLAKAPLNQLATALGSLVNHAMKLDEVIDDTDEQTEKIIQFQFVSGNKVTRTPPWTRGNTDDSDEVQGDRLRETMGENGAGEDNSDSERSIRRDAWVVARSNSLDVESGVAGFEGDLEERNWYHD